MTKYKIKDLLLKGKENLSTDIIIEGWVRSFRSNRFIALNDGSTPKNIQCVVDFENFDPAVLSQVTTAASLRIEGTVAESMGKEQDIEIIVKNITVYGTAHPDDVQETILQPKRHSLEKLREQAHLRFRTNLFSSVMRVRHNLAFAIHEYFHKKGFYYIHTPIITHSDAEGAGETFRVTTLDIDNPPRKEDGTVNYEEDFFGKGKLASQIFLERKLDATAIICFNDEFAIGMIKGFQEMGVNVPEQISVMGIDGTGTRKYLSPSLTTVNMFPRKQGRECANVLIDIIEKKNKRYIVHLKSKLQTGESVKDLHT